MILKIQDYTKAGWWIIGELKKMHYKEIYLKDVVNLESDYQLMVFDEVLAKQDGRKGLEIHTRDTNNQILNIITDAICFICNNEGKTIEKISVHN